MRRIAVICGGISQERGISLNSARSLLDHISSLEVDLTLLYLNPEGLYYQLTPGQLYSNTPSDFDFKLNHLTTHIKEDELISILKKMDVVFPLMHGIFGEDGTIQRFLETHEIPYIGSPSTVCKNVFNKHTARELLAKMGFCTLPALLISCKDTPIESFWMSHHLDQAVIKPTESGSSIGVTYVSSLSSAKKTIAQLWDKGFHELLLEPYCQEIEFTVCVLENHKGNPTALIPLEIDIGRQVGVLLDFRRKYLPTEETRYYCPPRFSEKIIESIRSQASKLFKNLGLRDLVRIDGWITKNNEILFSDFNPISGMEQNSFLFQQAAKIEMSHTDLITYVLGNALQRYGKKPLTKKNFAIEQTTPIYILMGGVTAERQVSLMSGTNVWLKLRQETHYKPTPFLLDKDNKVWQLPYSYTLHHTVEEIKEQCLLPENLSHTKLKQHIRKELGLPPIDFPTPVIMDFETFLKIAKQDKAFVFLALHGGIGEDGTIQKFLEDHKIRFNGSRALTSQLCMDKRKTSLCIEALQDPHILSMPQLPFELSSVKKEKEIQRLWQEATTYFKTEDLLVKPRSDGCSAGVVRLHTLEEFFKYIDCCHQGKTTFSHQNTLIEMPLFSEDFLLEPFILTDKIIISGSNLSHQLISGWCEMTIGIVEKQGVYSALPPSMTIAQNHILSLEEKFQGGTGVNITPPPENLLSKTLCKKVMERAAIAAKALDIHNYARLDLFVECKTGNIRLIEANTLPALTPSTVLFHQALSASPSITPRELLSLIIENAKANRVETLGIE